MTEIKPLLESGGSTRMRELLEAARADAPPIDFQGRILAGLGVGAAVVGTSTAAAAGTGALVPAAAAPKAALGALAVVKWVLIGVAGGGLLAAGADAVFQPVVTPASPAPAITATQLSRKPARRVNGESAAMSSAAMTLVDTPPLKVGERSVATVTSRAPSALAPASASPSAARSGQLGREVRLIDAARRAFAAGQFSRAFAELEAYDRIARTGVLDREARVLRIEILHQAGDRAQADSLTQQYLREFPGDEHAARLRALSTRGQR